MRHAVTQPVQIRARRPVSVDLLQPRAGRHAELAEEIMEALARRQGSADRALDVVVDRLLHVLR